MGLRVLGREFGVWGLGFRVQGVVFIGRYMVPLKGIQGYVGIHQEPYHGLLSGVIVRFSRGKEIGNSCAIAWGKALGFRA